VTDVRIRPNDALQVFPYSDDYSFGILQSKLHWLWFVNRCSTLKSDPRYTSNTVFDTFPWPQKPSAKAIKAVAVAAVALRKMRNELRTKHNLSLRELYRSLELPGDHALKAADAALDEAVRKAYGMTAAEDPLAYLFSQCSGCYGRDERRFRIRPPACPPSLMIVWPMFRKDA
jgi:hypothetical protein